MKRLAILLLTIPICAAAQTQKVTYSFLPFGFSNLALGINDREEVLTQTADNGHLAGLFTTDGQSLPFSFLDALTGQFSVATAFNNRNEFVGQANDSSKGYVLYQNGTGSSTSAQAQRLQLVQNPGPQSFIRPVGVNDAGVIIATYIADSSGLQTGLRYQQGQTTIISFPGSMETIPHAVNDSGVIVGGFVDSTHRQHGFIYTPETLGTGTYVQFDVPYALDTEIDGINSLGELAGIYVGQKAVSRGYVYSGGKATTINYPLVTTGQLFITGLNEEGQISGYLQQNNFGFVGTPSYLSGF